MSNEILHLSVPSPNPRAQSNPRKCKIHPLVVLEILDQFVRTEDQERVIGTLLGVNVDGVIEARSSYPVPYTTNDEDVMEPNVDFHRKMYQNKLRTNPQELIVGWYSTGDQIDTNSVSLHDFYWKEIGFPPVHMLIDPYSLTQNNTLGLKGFTAQSLGVGGEKHGFIFQSLDLELGTDLENFNKLGVEVLFKGSLLSQNQHGALIKDLDSLEHSVKKLHELLTLAESYVRSVLDGKEKPDLNAGRMLWEVVTALPRVDPAVLEKTWNNTITDLLMIVYLANLTKAQILTTEKLYSLPSSNKTSANSSSDYHKK
eukprot:TRINITY_DN1418_c0_g1_i1.p1 TRINITY_DN1418_c0_g1~~TRINITY_DN1418_c0_g1_i1.p1  ORF type:complete len:313 (-),score=74.65 TRINITY_DN1418_c0_g1_i1:42-980(-)